jgi:hypothetical protein
MSYSKLKFGAALLLKIEDGYSIQEIARWASKIYNELFDEMDDELSLIVQDIGSMSFGEQFEIPIDKLKEMAIHLIKTRNPGC